MRSLCRREDGQAAVETAIVTPTLVIFILGTVQITLMQQASLMLEYAAFTAARVGSVWNMDKEKMRHAAVISMLPVSDRIDTTEKFLTAFATATALEYANAALASLGLPERLEIRVMSPKKAVFGTKKEIEFDNVANRQNTLLTVGLTYWMELKIPFVNWVIWESWWLGMAGKSLNEWKVGQPKTMGMMGYLGNPDVSKSCPWNGVNKKKLVVVRVLAYAGKYFIPLATTYTMRMQSNPFLHKPGKSSELWAAPDKPDC